MRKLMLTALALALATGCATTGNVADSMSAQELGIYALGVYGTAEADYRARVAAGAADQDQLAFQVMYRKALIEARPVIDLYCQSVQSGGAVTEGMTADVLAIIESLVALIQEVS